MFAVAPGTHLALYQIDHAGKTFPRKEITVIFAVVIIVQKIKLFVMRNCFVQRINIKRENNAFEFFAFVADSCIRHFFQVDHGAACGCKFYGAAVEGFIYVLKKKVPGHRGPEHEKVKFFMFQKRRSSGIQFIVDCVIPDGHPVTVKGVNDIDQERSAADDGNCNGKNDFYLKSAAAFQIEKTQHFVLYLFEHQ